MVNYKVIDNFLNKDLFKKIKDFMLSSHIPWIHSPYVAHKDANDGTYFLHKFFDNREGVSFSFPYIGEVINMIKPEVLIRVKANLYMGSDKFYEHAAHSDFTFPHKGLLLSINTNNGYTKLKDGTKIKSVENRALFFDPSILHNSTNCSDEKTRININFNWI